LTKSPAIKLKIEHKKSHTNNIANVLSQIVYSKYTIFSKGYICLVLLKHV